MFDSYGSPKEPSIDLKCLFSIVNAETPWSKTGTMFAVKICTLARTPRELHHKCDSLLNAVVANDILCVIAVRVALIQVIWEPRYLTVVFVLTTVLSATRTGSGGCK